MMDLPVKALSIRQPWAWAIIHAGKDVENRDWPTRFRGPVAIHAALGITRAEWDEGMAVCRAIFRSDASPERRKLPSVDNQLRGGIIGVAEIVDCVDASTSPWFFGHFGFVLRNARPVPFMPVRGALGFFDWRDRQIKARP